MDHLRQWQENQNNRGQDHPPDVAIILPFSYEGSPRNLKKPYNDPMIIALLVSLNSHSSTCTMVFTARTFSQAAVY